MKRNNRFDLPVPCRDFCDSDQTERLRVAERFVRRFTEGIAPPKSFDERDEAWSLAVRRKIIGICPKDCYALPDGSQTEGSGLLTDYIWTELSGAKRVVFACVCEWGTGWFGRTNWGRVEAKFDRLLSVKAPLKLLIFSSCWRTDSSEPSTDFSFAYAKKMLAESSLQSHRHHLPGETYMFVDFPQTRRANGNGAYRSFLWVSERLGPQRVNFVDGPGGNLMRPSGRDWVLNCL